MLVSDYMSKTPVTIVQNADYDGAFEIMETKNLHHLPVVNKKGYVVGIVTRRDLQLAARHFHEAPAEICEVMHAPVVTITSDASLATAAERMTRYRIGGLPVLDQKKRLVGMLTETDLFEALMKLLEDQGGKQKKRGKGKKGAKRKLSSKATTEPAPSPTKKKPAAKKKSTAKKKPAAGKKPVVRKKSAAKKKSTARKKSVAKKSAAKAR